MPLDTSIYNALAVPKKSALDYANEFDNQAYKRQTNALSMRADQLKLGEMEQGARETDAVRNALATYRGDERGRIAALRDTGTIAGLKQAEGLQKALDEGLKVKSEVNKNNAATQKTLGDAQTDALKRYRSALDFVDTPQGAARWMQAQYADPTVGEYMAQTLGPLDQALGRISSLTPQQFQQWRQQAALGMEKHIQEQRMGAAQTETARHNKVSEGIQAGQLGVSRERLNFDKTQPRGQYDAARGLWIAPGGVATPATLDGQPIDPRGADKPLPAGALKQITEVRDNAATIDRLSTSFKPEFAGKGVLGFGGDAQMAVSGNIGADKDSVEWWKNYRKQAELVERHALFGAALTPGEQKSWRSADIAPGMHPDVVARNLATRNALAKKVLENTRQDLIDAGHSERRVGAIAGRGQSGGGATGDFTAPAFGDAEKERRYQEWKAKQK